jgi:outer membrane protein TolC
MTDMLGSLPVPGIADLINPLPHEQYKVTLEINQILYDGGAIKGSRAFEKANLAANEKQTETDLYKLREQVNSSYFNLLLIGRQKELLDSYLELVNERISSMNSALNSGVLLKSDIDILISEKIKLEQQIKESKIRENTLLKILSDLTGTEIDNSTQFILPSITDETEAELSRPELQMFDLRKDQLDASLQVIQSKRMPKAFGFATVGYGNPPGNNFFKDEFAPYYIVGAGVKWNIFDWNKAKNEKQVISLQQNIIENRKDDLTENLKRLLEAKQAEITNLKSLVISDTELIAIRTRITATSESQYDNGTITITEYMNQMNSEKEAQINHEIHKINLAKAQVEYYNISGEDIE